MLGYLEGKETSVSRKLTAVVRGALSQQNCLWNHTASCLDTEVTHTSFLDAL